MNDTHSKALVAFSYLLHFDKKHLSFNCPSTHMRVPFILCFL